MSFPLAMQVVPLPPMAADLMTITSHHEFSIATACKAFEQEARKKGQVCPTFCAFFTDMPNPRVKDREGPALGLIETSWGSPDERNLVIDLMRAIYADLEPVRYSVWSEVWVSAPIPVGPDGEMPSPEELAKHQPSKSENRTEHLFVATVDRAVADIMVTRFFIERPWDGGTPSLRMDRENLGDGFAGELVNLIPRPPKAA